MLSLSEDVNRLQELLEQEIKHYHNLREMHNRYWRQAEAKIQKLETANFELRQQLPKRATSDNSN